MRMAPSYKLCVGGATRTPTLWPIGLIPMKTRYVLPLILLAAWIPRATAQHYVLVKDGEKMSIVVAADNVSPLVLHGDKLEIVHATKFALGEGGEYLPKFVAIRNPDAKTSSISMEGGPIQMRAGDGLFAEARLCCDRASSQGGFGPLSVRGRRSGAKESEAVLCKSAHEHDE